MASPQVNRRLIMTRIPLDRKVALMLAAEREGTNVYQLLARIVCDWLDEYERGLT